MHTGYPLRTVVVVVMVFLSVRCAVAADARRVAVHDNGDSVTLDNGVVSFNVVKSDGNFDALKYGGVSILAEPGYLDWIGPKNNHIAHGIFSVVANPADNGGEMAEVSVTQKFAGGPSRLMSRFIMCSAGVTAGPTAS